ncbi:MAG: formyltransferase family protein, partial [Nitrospirota bacterium]
MPDAPLRLAVLASGRGSNLQAIIDAIKEGRLRAVLAVVISNKAEAQALERARKHGAPAVFLDPKATPGRDAYDAVILEHLRKHDVGLVALAGYMKIVTRV